MADIKINIINIEAIKRAFALSPRLMTIELNRAIQSTVFTIGRKSRQNAPVDTGRLRASHYERFEPLRGEVGTNVDYDIFVHEGTRFMQARPYLARAVDSSSFAIDGFFTDAVQNVLNKIAGMT